MKSIRASFQHAAILRVITCCSHTSIATLAVLAALNAFVTPGRAESWWEKMMKRQAPSDSKPAETAPSPTPGAPQPTIPVVVPKVETVAEYVELTGNATSVNAVKLIARVEGYLEQIHFADGAIVKEGDLLFTIQQDLYKSQLVQAESQLKAQTAALFLAQTEVARYTKLQKQGAAAQVVVDNWNFQAKKSEAEVASAQAQVEIAKLNLGYTEVRAPFDGLMGKHLIDPGNVVGGGGQQAALAEIIQLNPIYVVANLSEQDVLKIRANLGDRRLTLSEITKIPVDVGLGNGTDFPLHGALQYVTPGTDPSTGTLFLRGILKNPDRTLLPGFFVRMRIPKGRVLQGALMIPDRALQADQGGRYLLIVNKDNIIEQRYVELGELSGELRVITAGLQAGDRVVAGDFWRANPGTKVTPKLVTLGEVENNAKSSTP
ncbi:MAG: efflux RND transporter periplasmic adaptor subunit [Beijerinckiaceae bacterium]